ncbi:flippase-like domain-containing protein [Candidatus Micrarchaeota archaeon]|nr:flippase-like domain-containing protein [Candidatus Micrarchaeota archaeon]
METKSSILISIVVSLIIFFVIAYFIDVGRLLSVISNANVIFLVLALCTYFLLNLLMIERIRVLMAAMGSPLKFTSVFFSHFGGMLASDFTPARSGYFLTAFLLSSNGKATLEKGLTSIFAPQLLEFLLKVICTGLLTVLIVFQFGILGTSNPNWPIYVFVAIFAITLVVSFFLSLLFSKDLLEKFSFLRFLPLGKKFYSLFHLMRKNSGVLLSNWTPVAVFTLGSWLLRGLEWYFISSALNIHIFGGINDYFFMLLFQPFLTLVQFLPLPTLAGAGASEAAGAFFLSLLGVPIETGVVFVFLTRSFMILVDLLGIAALSSLLSKDGFGGLLNDLSEVESRC